MQQYAQNKGGRIVYKSHGHPGHRRSSSNGFIGSEECEERRLRYSTSTLPTDNRAVSEIDAEISKINHDRPAGVDSAVAETAQERLDVLLCHYGCVECCRLEYVKYADPSEVNGSVINHGAHRR